MGLDLQPRAPPMRFKLFVLFCFVYTEHNFLVWLTNGSGCYRTTGAIAQHCGFYFVEIMSIFKR